MDLLMIQVCKMVEEVLLINLLKLIKGIRIRIVIINQMRLKRINKRIIAE